MIDSCPLCRYSLTGLPDDHVCPECGFWYERDAVLVEEHGQSWGFYVGVVCVSCLLAAGSWQLTGRLSGIYPASVPTLSALVAGLWQARLPKNAGLVSRRSLRLFRRGVVEQEIPLAGIRGARWSFVDGRIVITGTGGKTLFVVPNRFLLTNKRAKALVAAINEYARLCSSS